MPSPKDQYTREVHKQFSYFATWVPNVTLKLGDVGVFRNHEMTHMTTLDELGITFRERRGIKPATYEYSSAGSVSVHIKAAGSAPIEASALTTAEAGIVVKFSRENAVYFRLDSALVHTIDNQDKVGKEIINRYQLGDWDEDYAVVTEVIAAGASIVLISNGKDAQIDLKASAGVNPLGVELGSLTVGLGVGSFKSMHTSIVGAQGLTPLFRARKVKKGFLRGARFRDAEQASFDTMGYDDMV